MENIYIRLLDMGYKTEGVTVTDPEGDYNVYLNSRLSEEARKKAADHELKHIHLGHFENMDSVYQNELEAG